MMNRIKKIANRLINSSTDEEYLAAVEAGDMDKAQKMVDEAAKSKGYNTEAWHGSDEEDFNVFTEQKTATGFYFTPDEQGASFYGKVRRFYLRIHNLADITDDMEFYKIAKEAIWDLEEERDKNLVKEWVEDNIENTEEGREFAMDVLKETKEQFSENWGDDDWGYVLDEIIDRIDWNEFTEAIKKRPEMLKSLNEYAPVESQAIKRAYEARGSQDWYMDYQDDFVEGAGKMGYDGVLMYDPPGSTGGDGLSYVVQDSNQIKLAGVTKDDEDKVIPLSKRFNSGSHDIRY